ncbi:MAG: alpha/beta hydrolase [Patescibacteria group bacterium]|nr:alpha/beta hydrolase [Patescibacteria group bacterium]
MKKIYLVCGWEGTPGKLFEWMADELRKEGLEVEALSMPNQDEPVIKDWVAKLNEVVGNEPNKNIIFVGHSIGCQAILRYLAGLENPGWFGGVVFIAPWLKVSGLETEEEQEIAKPWVKTSIDSKKVLAHIPKNKIVAIFSDNDPFVPKENWELFEHLFGAKVIIESGKGHITYEEGVHTLPSALEAVLKMIE